MTDAHIAIEEKSRYFERCYNSNDPAGLVEGYFAEDAEGPTASPPVGQVPVRGRAALIGMFTAMIPDAPRIQLELIDLIVSDNVAYEFGRAHLTLADGTQVKGRYTVGWIKREEWRAKIDFFAADGWEG